MIAIVTGAKGFVGRALCHVLESRGVEVYGVDIDGWNRTPPEETPGAVFYHLAWVGKAGPLRADWRVQLRNVEMALDYFEQAKRMRCGRFICAGTIGEKMLSLPECAQLQSQNRIYVNSKLYLHGLLRNLDHGGCKVLWATLGNLYGVGVAGGSIIDYALRTILRGEVAEFGPGEQPYDFVNVEDAIRALAEIGLGERVVSEEFYVGSGRPLPLKEYLRKVGEIAGRPDLVGIGKKPDDGTRFREEWFSIAPLTDETGYVPTIGFEEGVRENIAYLQSLSMGDGDRR